MDRYLASMVCSPCRGAGKVRGKPCRKCGGDGNSARFKHLLWKATSGLRK